MTVEGFVSQLALITTTKSDNIKTTELHNSDLHDALILGLT